MEVETSCDVVKYARLTEPGARATVGCRLTESHKGQGREGETSRSHEEADLGQSPSPPVGVGQGGAEETRWFGGNRL